MDACREGNHRARGNGLVGRRVVRDEQVLTRVANPPKCRHVYFVKIYSMKNVELRAPAMVVQSSLRRRCGARDGSASSTPAHGMSRE